MDKITQDRRIARTETRLQNGLIQLLAEKPIDRISVTELCEIADVNRNTFYAHYQSLAQLLERIEDDMIERVSDRVDQLFSGANIHSALTQVLNEVQKRKALFLLLMDTSSNFVFFAKISDLVHDRVVASWRSAGFRGTDDDVEQIFGCVINGCLCVIRSWLSGGMVKTPAEVALFIEKLAVFGISAFIPGIVQLVNK